MLPSTVKLDAPEQAPIAHGPSFMSLEVDLLNPLIWIPCQALSDKRIEVDLGHIAIRNKQVLLQIRILLE